LANAQVLPLIGTPSPYSNSQIADVFSLNYFSASNLAIAVLGGGIVGLIGVIFKQGIFAIYAVLVFVLGLFLGVGNWILYGMGSLVTTLLGGTGFEWIGSMLSLFTTIVFFMFLASILSQRQDFP